MVRAVLCVAAALLAAAPVTQAQPFPSKPIRVIVPYSAGGLADVILRRVVQKIADTNGPQILVDNKPGAAATAAVVALKQAPADGYTVMLGDSSSLAVNVSLVPDLPFDPVKDLQPITMLWTFPSILGVPASLGVKNIAELKELAAKKPGGLNYGSTGIGSGGHLIGSMLASAFGTPMTHVPYRSGPPAFADLVAGRIDLIFASYSSLKPFVENKQASLLGVASRRHLTAVPDVPTMAEAGYPKVELDTWFGLVALEGTDMAVVEKLNELFVKAANSPDLVEAFNRQATPIQTTSVAQFEEMIKNDIARMRVVVKDAGAKAN